ncbi:hypothetical protein RB195_011943 [Necator americanus]|uniref:Uncharacterized protein n=1 Tax=Necator americanus TaxID=51031 RepID=A0ABR1D6C9_NECAM
MFRYNLAERRRDSTSSRREMKSLRKVLLEPFRSSTRSSPFIPTGEAPPRILPSEVRVAIKSMKPGTAPDLILFQQTFFGLVAIRSCNLSSAHDILSSEKRIQPVKTSRTVLIHKKVTEDLRNYRPICLLSVLYKVFTKSSSHAYLDADNQPQEQAGFRQGFSSWTTSRPCQVIRFAEYRLPFLTFVTMKSL